jgi:hypothetical protein
VSGAGGSSWRVSGRTSEWPASGWSGQKGGIVHLSISISPRQAVASPFLVSHVDGHLTVGDSAASRGQVCFRVRA